MSKLKIKNGNTWEEVPAGGVGVPVGGTQGQVLIKTGSADYATGWGTASDIGAMGKWVKLWENASPSSAFAGQTISVDLSGYDLVAVCGLYATNNAVQTWSFVSVPPSAPSGEYRVGWLYHYVNYRQRRDVVVYTDGILFGNGNEAPFSGDLYTNNLVMIPYRIYGIKGVANA